MEASVLPATSPCDQEALSAGTLGQLADAHRVLWEECEHDSDTNGGPVSHALLFAMVGSRAPQVVNSVDP